MVSQRPVVTKEAEVWVLRLQTPRGKVQEYRCTSEGQAQALAALLSRPDPGAPPSPAP